MTKGRKTTPIIERTILVRSKKSFVQKLNERISLGQILLKKEIESLDQLGELETEYYNWNDVNSEVLKQFFNRPDNEYYYRYSRLNTMSGFLDYTRGVNTDHPSYRINQLKGKIENCINELNQLIEKAELMEEENVVQYIEESKAFYNVGFIIHGHDEVRKYEVSRFIEHEMLKKAIILHDQANKGRTIIEKFEANSNVDFAVALWTADDQGKSKKENDLKDRARQNVIFETGYFVGKLTRTNVVVLYEHGVDIPTDYLGVVFIPFDGNWKNDLRKEIVAIYEI